MSWNCDVISLSETAPRFISAASRVRVLTGVPHGFHTVWKTLKNHDDNAGVARCGAPVESCDLFDQKNKCAAVLRRIGPVS